MKKKNKFDIEKNKKILHESFPSCIVAGSLGILCNFLFRLSQDLHLTNLGNYCAICVVICLAWLLCFGFYYLIYLIQVKQQEKEKEGEIHEDK